jgi:hypothetical protein
MLDHEHREGNRVGVGVHTRIPFCHFVCGAGSISRTNVNNEENNRLRCRRTEKEWKEAVAMSCFATLMSSGSAATHALRSLTRNGACPKKEKLSAKR